MNIKTKNRKSPLWNLIKIFFPNADMSKTYMQFNKTIWMPKGVTECPQEMYVHEGTHLLQAGYSFWGSTKWWAKYIVNKKFRYEQELDAYQVQMKWFNEAYKDLSYKKKYEYRTAVALILSSKMYGSIVDTKTAFKELGDK